MADNARVYVFTAAALAAAFGAGAERLASDSFDTSAEVREVRFLGDGQIAVGLTTKIGDCVGDREYVYDADGTRARLNGRPTDDADALAIGAAAAALHVQASKIDRGIADRPVGARLLGDGQLAITLAADVDGGVIHKEMVYAADGGAPRVNGVPTDEKTTNDVGPALAAFKAVADEKVPTLKDALTKPLADVAAVAESQPLK